MRAARNGCLVALWTEATRAEAERVVGAISPLSGSGLSDVFGSDGYYAGPLDLAPFAHLAGAVDRTLAALAEAAGAPLVTADGPLQDGARASGVDVLRPSEAVRWLTSSRAPRRGVGRR